METRQPYSTEEIYKRRFQRSKSKDDEKSLQISLQEKNEKCKHNSTRSVLLIVVAVMLILIMYSLTIRQHEYISHVVTRRHFVKRWRRDGGSDTRYTSHLQVKWYDISNVMTRITDGNKMIHGVGLLNFNESEIRDWNEILPETTKHVALHLDPVDKNVTWDTLYPEWIDEEQEDEVPSCPAFPKLDVPRKRLDAIAVKLPCRNEGNWSRDVGRLHLQLAAAGVAAAAVHGSYPVHLVFVSKCVPVPNLFPCKELVARRGDVWLYRPNLNVLREKLQLPVGSCELALPYKAQDGDYRGDIRRKAYVTILHSADVYVCGAITAAQSIRMAGSTRDLVILVDETISDHHRRGLESAGWKIRTIRRIRNPKAEKDAYNEWNYSKFRLWQLTDYDKIIFIDADLLVLRNIDFLFGMPEISATGNNGTLFNSGVMVIEPSNCTFRLLMDNINEIESYNGGDQGYLNEIFTWWHRIPRHMNFLKNFWVGDGEEVKEKKTWLFGADPPVLYVLHYLGMKPWLCYRDYDCNWNSEIFQEFASDVAHERWWKVHDAMPAPLREFCLLPSKQKAQLEWDRRQAEKAKFPDGHWRVEIMDDRKDKCIDKLCKWKGMLKHWGRTNRTNERSVSPPPPPPPVTKVTAV